MDESGVCQKAPPIPALDFVTTIAFASLATSKMMPPAYALPFASNATVGSLHASAVWLSSWTNWKKGGIWSPQLVPRLNDQS